MSELFSERHSPLHLVRCLGELCVMYVNERLAAIDPAETDFGGDEV